MSRAQCVKKKKNGTPREWEEKRNDHKAPPTGILGRFLREFFFFFFFCNLFPGRDENKRNNNILPIGFRRRQSRTSDWNTIKRGELFL